MPGVGRGHNPNSHRKLWGAPLKKQKLMEQRDPQLPTSVPMPSAVEDITDAGMRAMWERDGEVEQEPLD